jgi:hypothetical protein
MKSRLLSSSTQKATRVVIKLITVQDVHHVHVFTSRPVLTHQADLTVVRMKTREVSVQRALVAVCRVSHVHRENMVSHVAAIVPVTTIIKKAAISLVSRVVTVPVLSTDNLRLKNSVSSHVVAISLVNSRVVTVPVLSTDNLRLKNSVSSHVVATSLASSRVVIVLVHNMVSLRKAVTSLVAISPVVAISRAVTNRVAIRDVLRVALVLKRRSRSHTIPMLSTL